MRMKWRDCAHALGIAENELYQGLRSGLYPGMKVGQRRGRWVCDTELVQERINQLMQANVREIEQPVVGIRRVK